MLVLVHVLAPLHSAVQFLSATTDGFPSLVVVESYASEVVFVMVVLTEGWREQVEFAGVEFTN